MTRGPSIRQLTRISDDRKSPRGARRLTGALLAGFACLALGVAAQAQGPDVAAKKLQRAGFDQNLGAQIPLDLTFLDESGRPVKLAEYFNGERPVILTLNYYACPMLCTLILNGVVDCAKALPFEPGRDYDLVTVSFDPRDTPELAAAKKANYVKSLGREGAEKGWHFLCGKKPEIDALCKATGFSYVFDEKTGEFGHASGIMVATPQGRLSHYFYGMEYLAKDVKLGLIDASKGKIGSPVEKLLLWCLHYDPTSGKYTASIMRMIQLACGLMVAAVAAFLFVQLRREFRPSRKAAA